MTLCWEPAVRDPRRLAALEMSGLVGSGPDDAFDRLIELATELIGVSRGCITLVDSVRTTAMSAVGFPEGLATYAPVEHSFCRFVVGSARPLIIEDAHLDPRTCGDPAIALFDAISWAGFPVQDADGATLGTFCLMDARPHQWTERDLYILATLAKEASSEVELHRLRQRNSIAWRPEESGRHSDAWDRPAVAALARQLLVLGGSAAEIGEAVLVYVGEPPTGPGGAPAC